MPVITVDHRENARILVDELLTAYGYEVDFRQLKLGDYHIPPDTVVERKTAADFAASILDGRLFSQAYRLAEHCKYPLIILENGDAAGPDRIDPAAVKGALITLAQTYRLPVIHSGGQKESAWVIHALCRHRKRLGCNAGVLKGLGLRHLRGRQILLLRALPGVGPKIAARLLKQFGSLRGVLNTTPADLASVTGISRTRAAEIVSFLCEGD